MAKFSVQGVQETDIFAEAADMPDEVKVQMVEAMARATITAQKKSADSHGVVELGTTRDSIRMKSKPRVTQDGCKVTVTFMGSRTDERHKQIRNAEVAFVNEFGKAGQKARPFVSDANKQHGEEIHRAGVAVYDKWIADKTKG